MAIKSFSSIVSSMKSYIRSKFPSLDTSEGTLANDVVMSAPAREIEQIYDELAVTQDSQSINTAPDAALSQHAENITLMRKQARKSRGSVTFFSNASPTSNVTVPVGSYVSTFSSTASPSVQFVTTQTVTMYASIAQSYLNATTGKYEVTVGVESGTAGSVGNVGSQTVASIVNPILGIDGCYNSEATSGGLDVEPGSTLQSRIAAKWKGSFIGTVYGYESEMSSLNEVDDVLVVGGTAVDRQDVGAVDIYLKGKNSKSFSDSFMTNTTTFDDLILSQQPVLSDETISVTSSASGSISSSLWSFQVDSSAYGGSILAQDKIQWVTPLSSTYGTIFVTYNYNYLVTDAQNILSKDDKFVLNTDVLAKWATETPIDIEMNVAVLSGFDFADISSIVSTEITTFLDSLGIGDEVQQADVARIVLNVPGVDDVTLPFTTFRSSDSLILRDVQGNLTMPSKAYPSAGTLTFNQIT